MAKLMLCVRILLILSGICVNSQVFEKEVIVNIRENNIEQLKVVIKRKNISRDTKNMCYAHIKYYQGDMKNAESYLKKIVKGKKQSRIRIIAEYLLRILYLGNDYDEYLSTINVKLENDIKNGEFKTAINRIETLIHLDPSNIHLKMLYCEIAISLKFPITAIRSCMEIFELLPQEEQIEHLLDILVISFILLEQYRYLDVHFEMGYPNYDINRVINLIKNGETQRAKIEFIKIMDLNESSRIYKKDLYQKIENVLMEKIFYEMEENEFWDVKKRFRIEKGRSIFEEFRRW